VRYPSFAPSRAICHQATSLFSNAHILLIYRQYLIARPDTNVVCCHVVAKQSGEKKLTIDQEFEQYFSRLML
jgi:hypothetical protein